MFSQKIAATVIFLTLHIISGCVAHDSDYCKMRGLFSCNGTNLCIEQSQMCNNVSDCPNGTDEIDCVDEHNNLYWDHLYRKNPRAEQDDFEDICLLPYNGTCRCKQRSIYCQYKKYNKAPDNLPAEDINMLDFTGNFFKKLDGESLKSLPAVVEILVLGHCSVRRIEEGAFYKLASLQELHLDNNELKTFPRHIFPSINNLSKLVLSYNSIITIEEEAFESLTNLQELELNNNGLEEIGADLLRPLIRLKTLLLRGNKLSVIDVDTFPRLPLETLSLDDNLIASIESGSFQKLEKLQRLILSNNKLMKIVTGTFSNLTNLRGLFLQFNLVEEIEDDVFLPTYKLESLDLQGNTFRHLNKKVLMPLTKLQHIYFNRFEMCVAAPHVRVCNPKGDGISSFSHLLDNPVLRASVWIMGVIGCVGNLLVFLGRLLTPTTNKVHSLYIRNLAFSDLLMGVYLLTIAGVDHHYRGVYLDHQKEWRESTCCSLCGFLSTLSCESSVLIITLVTWDRFISITQPFARIHPSVKTATFTLVFLWGTAIIVALAPLLPPSITNGYFGKDGEFYGNNGVCLSLHIHEPYAPGWIYSAAMFICLNTLALIFICYAYLRMIHEIKASGNACRSTQRAADRDKVAQRYVVIVLTDCMCWVPIICVKLAAFFVDRVPDTLYAWLAVLILPINSALNPVLYTLTTTVFKKQIRKLYNSCIYKRKRYDHSGYDSSGIFPLGSSTKRTRATQSSVASSKNNSWRRSTAV